jgi:hypothetical protein
MNYVTITAARKLAQGILHVTGSGICYCESKHDGDLMQYLPERKKGTNN